jgi:hypothetical protein
MRDVYRSFHGDQIVLDRYLTWFHCDLRHGSVRGGPRGIVFHHFGVPTQGQDVLVEAIGVGRLEVAVVCDVASRGLLCKRNSILSLKLSCIWRMTEFCLSNASVSC